MPRAACLATTSLCMFCRIALTPASYAVKRFWRSASVARASSFLTPESRSGSLPLSKLGLQRLGARDVDAHTLDRSALGQRIEVGAKTVARIPDALERLHIPLHSERGAAREPLRQHLHLRCGARAGGGLGVKRDVE